MPALKLIRLDSRDHLRQQQAAWDDLWLRSEVTAPTARAELVADWIDHFARDERFSVLVVAEGDRYLAALPLVGRRLHRLVEVASLPSNCWSAAGELLLDPQADEQVLAMLIQGLANLPWPLLWLEGVNLDSPGWRRLIAALARAGVEHEVRADCDVGFVDIGHDWPAYEAAWSKNHRKAMRKTRDRLEQAGAVTCLIARDVSPEQVEPLLRRAFEVEDRSWKGPAGTSVLRSAGIFDYFSRQARHLAERGELEVSWLELSGEPIAFEYGYRAKGVYCSHKVGYDERFAAYGPGQLLMLELLKQFHADEGICGVDCLGPLTDAVARWTNRTYSCGRLIIAPRRLWGGALLATYRAAQPWARCWRRSRSGSLV